MQDESHPPLWRTKSGVVLIGFLAVAAYLMHLFMHGGHGGAHRHRD